MPVRSPSSKKEHLHDRRPLHDGFRRDPWRAFLGRAPEDLLHDAGSKRSYMVYGASNPVSLNRSAIRHMMRALASLLTVGMFVLLPACDNASGEPAQPESAATETAAVQVASADEPVLKVYKTPTCGCCDLWVDHAEEEGFATESTDLRDLRPIKMEHGVPGHLASCHTTIVGDYVVEGHVPADVIRRLLAEQPDIAGIAVPGMPMGSPGMEGHRVDPYDVIAFRKDGTQYIFESR